LNESLAKVVTELEGLGAAIGRTIAAMGEISERMRTVEAYGRQQAVTELSLVAVDLQRGAVEAIGAALTAVSAAMREGEAAEGRNAAPQLSVRREAAERRDWEGSDDAV
jgi:hypothetical protein